MRRIVMLPVMRIEVSVSPPHLLRSAVSAPLDINVFRGRRVLIYLSLEHSKHTYKIDQRPRKAERRE